QLVRLLLSCKWLGVHDRKYAPGIYGPATDMLRKRGRTKGRASLLELEKLLNVYGCRSDLIVGAWFSRWGGRFMEGWPDEAIWPYFAAHPEIIRDALDPSSPLQKEYSFSYERVYDALASFPSVPLDLVPVLFELALGGTKVDRAGAQRILDRLPGIA